MTTLKIVGGGVGLLILLGGIAWLIPSTVKVSRTFKHTPAQLWALWEQPDAIKKWWGPKNYSAPVVKSDLKTGGTYLLVMRSPSGSDSANVGTYLEVVPGRRIVQTMSFADAEGRPLPGSSVPVPGRWPDAVTVTTDFVAIEGGTEVHIREDGIPLIMKLLASLGWEQQFDKIEQLLGGSR
jgi:uncharacterized protein YndB with AHSA1/START domain